MVARGPISSALENWRKEEIGFQKNYRGAKTNFCRTVPPQHMHTSHTAILYICKHAVTGRIVNARGGGHIHAHKQTHMWVGAQWNGLMGAVLAVDVQKRLQNRKRHITQSSYKQCMCTHTYTKRIHTAETKTFGSQFRERKRIEGAQTEAVPLKFCFSVSVNTSYIIMSLF